MCVNRTLVDERFGRSFQPAQAARWHKFSFAIAVLYFAWLSPFSFPIRHACSNPFRNAPR
jgi:hypothetical protein